MSFLPPQIGFVPSGTNQTSHVVIGRDITGSWEAVGFGPDGRPDIAQQIRFNLVNRVSDTEFTQPIQIVLDTFDLVVLLNSNPNAPEVFYISAREVAICSGDDNGNTTEARMVVLASQPYLPAS